MSILLKKLIANKIVLSLVSGGIILTAGTMLIVRNASTTPPVARETGSTITSLQPPINSPTTFPSDQQTSLMGTGTLTPTPLNQSDARSSNDQPTSPTTQSAAPASASSQPSQATQAKTIDNTAIDFEEKQSGYCRALAPRDWSFTTNAEATGADLFAPDKTMHAGWGIAGVYTALYPDVDDFLNVWMPLAGYTGLKMQNPETLDEGFLKRDFTSDIGKKGFLIHKTYQFDPTVYVASVYFAAADNNIWASQGALPAFAAISIRCVSQLRPTTSQVDVSRSNPSKKSDNPEVSLSDKWTEAIMGYENVYSPSTGDHYQTPLNSRWETGPEGSGYYRSLPGGGYEKLAPGFGSY